MTRKPDDPAERPDADNPQWTREMFRTARSASEVLPSIIGAEAAAALTRRKPGRPPAAEKRVVRSFRLPAEVVAAYEATGPDWRRLVVETLRDHMPDRKKAG